MHSTSLFMFCNVNTFAPTVFSEDKGARPESRIVRRFGRLKPPDVLNEFDLFKHGASRFALFNIISDGKILHWGHVSLNHFIRQVDYFAAFDRGHHP